MLGMFYRVWKMGIIGMLGLLLPLLGILWGCGAEKRRIELPYNRFACAVDSVGPGCLLSAVTIGQDEGLKDFYALLGQELGPPRITYLHYTIEDWREFFDPGRRAIDPSILRSPFGLQKILVYDSVRVGETWLQLSLQAEPHRLGNRVVDPWFTYLELRARPVGLDSPLVDCGGYVALRDLMNGYLVSSELKPTVYLPDSAQLALERRYGLQMEVYAERVKGLLDPACYPPLFHREGTWQYRLQLCEIEGMRDTLWGRLRVQTDLGPTERFSVVDIVEDDYVEGVRIYDGPSGYVLYLEEGRTLTELVLVLEDGREVLLYERGDFMKEGLPFKPWRPLHEREAVREDKILS